MEISKVKPNIISNLRKQNPVSSDITSVDFVRINKVKVPLTSLRANFLCSFGSFDNVKNLEKCAEGVKNNFYLTKNNILKNDLLVFSKSVQENIEKNKLSETKDIIKVISPILYIHNNDLLDYSKEKFDSFYSFTAYAKMLVQKEFVKDVVDNLKNIQAQKAKLEMKEIQDLFQESCDKINSLHDADIQNAQVKKNLEYSNDATTDDIETITLTEEEISILRNKLENSSGIDAKHNLLSRLIDEHVDGSKTLRHTVGYRIQLAALQTCPRYDVSKDDRDKTIFKKHPLTRWLGIYPIDDIEAILDKFNAGDTYSYHNMQCCSKNMDFAEQFTAYRDDFIGANMKFVIHPKNNLTMAYDIGKREYGDREVIYPAFTKFNVLDRRLVAQQAEDGTFYRWVIHMQEK